MKCYTSYLILFAIQFLQHGKLPKKHVYLENCVFFMKLPTPGIEHRKLVPDPEFQDWNPCYAFVPFPKNLPRYKSIFELATFLPELTFFGCFHILKRKRQLWKQLPAEKDTSCNTYQVFFIKFCCLISSLKGNAYQCFLDNLKCIVTNLQNMTR